MSGSLAMWRGHTLFSCGSGGQVPYATARTWGPGGFLLVAGARFAPDSESVSVVTARWLYAGVKQGTREMVRVGLAS